MPRVSERKLDPQIEERTLKLLYHLVGELNQENSRKVLKALLTPEERLMLAKRIGAILMISAGYNYKQLDQILKIVPVTTNKLKKQIKQNQKIIRDLLSILNEQETVKEFYKGVKEKTSQKS